MKTDYTLEEWTSLLSAPFLTAMMIIVSDMNIGFFSEIGALTQAVMGTVTGTKNELLKAVAADAVAKDTQRRIRPELEAFRQEGDPALIQAALQQAVVGAAETVSAKSAEDGEAYRKWLVYLAEKTAEGSKEGGFLGISAVRVSEKEMEALAELRQALGVAPA